MGLKVESSCILSALCFWIGNLLRILVYTGAVGDSKAEFEFDMNKEKALKVRQERPSTIAFINMGCCNFIFSSSYHRQ